MEPIKQQPKQVLLNHEFCKVVIENGQCTLYIRMANGEHAVQRPYPADLRGQIGALTLALDVLAGKIILGGTVRLNENEFKPENADAVETLAIDGKTDNHGGVQ
jgi:hypothetical protein